MLRNSVMENFFKSFRREIDGTWTCIEPATLDGPRGRIQVTAGSKFARGAEFMGVDLAKWLDERCCKPPYPG